MNEDYDIQTETLSLLLFGQAAGLPPECDIAPRLTARAVPGLRIELTGEIFGKQRAPNEPDCLEPAEWILARMFGQSNPVHTYWASSCGRTAAPDVVGRER